MSRLRLLDFRNSGAASRIGLCYGDIPDIAREVNEAQRRLMMAKEAGDEGWYGTWAEIGFTLSRTSPYYTADRHIARLEMADVCNCPIPIYNQFTEYMQFGNGRMPKVAPWCNWPLRAAYTRNNVPTFVDITNPPQYVMVMATDVTDIEASKRVLIQGYDSNDAKVYSQDNGIRVDGVFLTLTSPFTISTMTFNRITGIQKDVTNGPVYVYSLDPTTGAQVLLLTMEASEQTAGYRRYYFDSLPLSCCPTDVTSSTPSTVAITAIAKLEPTPIYVDTDYFTLQGEGVIEAIADECEAVRYSKIDNPAAKAMAKERHLNAIGILNGILNHYLGKDSPAVNFKPFGSASLRKVKIGMI